MFAPILDRDGAFPRHDLNDRGRSASAGASQHRFVHLLSGFIHTEAAIELFHNLNVIATLRYEEVENSGTLILAQPGSTLPPGSVRFSNPVGLHVARGVRKYLEITDGTVCLFSNCRSALGFTRANTVDADSFTVQFKHGQGWDVRAFGECVLSVETIPRPPIGQGLDVCRLSREIAEVFPALTGIQISRLCGLAAAAALQKNGANILVSADAAREAERLRPQCTVIDPAPLTPAELQRFTAIDGTVIIDVDGVCHAIGAILDGGASGRGDRTRGGRYNSAVMYLDSAPAASLIVVISRDATVDVVSARSCRTRA